MYISPEDVEALYASIHRLAQKHVPDCTLAQVKAVAKRFHDRGTTRLQSAFVLYWQLAEERIEGTSADTFLEMLRTETALEKKRSTTKKSIPVAPSIKDYWKS